MQTVQCWEAESLRKWGRFWKLIHWHWRTCKNINVFVLREQNILMKGVGRKSNTISSTHHIHFWCGFLRNSTRTSYFNYKSSDPFRHHILLLIKNGTFWDALLPFSYSCRKIRSPGSKDHNHSFLCASLWKMQSSMRLHFYQLRVLHLPTDWRHKQAFLGGDSNTHSS